MLKKLTFILLGLSVLLLSLAALVGPEELALFLDSEESVQAEKNTSASQWCADMENKPNKQWQEDEFQRFAEECL
ncbi:DUF3012 domain-containing protein [uncultured Pseudoteredinibacter sp.]|uniref:DUF3012 domain-containing protein n=1 Tax=uncultured Pseudoteredinibacter sp. TaxID=1641701 RepID=UPI00261D829A|nr:DUF3012 domain-containing protein [uncultured Pseudoteredinibacter sp.]